MQYYPIMLDISGKKCIIAGGGNVAYRKAVSLLRYNAEITVISPDLCSKFEEIGNKIAWIPENFKPEDIKDAFLVFAATDDIQTNKMIQEEATRQKIPVNIANIPELCDFIVPSVFEQGDLTISVSTNGKSPMLAKKIKQELQERYNSGYAEFLAILGTLRQESAREISCQSAREALYNDITGSNILDLVKKGMIKQAKQEVYRIFECYRTGKHYEI
jgi:precorrin-2 dehydrogenase/sirohydrochlorin ferrochelatase